MNVNITTSAKRDISILQEKIRENVWQKLKKLQDGQVRYKKLKISASYSLRVEDYRVIFDIDKKGDAIIKSIKHRKDVYRRR
jgi:mRNA interferase RelE/StbE